MLSGHRKLYMDAYSMYYVHIQYSLGLFYLNRGTGGCSLMPYLRGGGGEMGNEAFFHVQKYFPSMEYPLNRRIIVKISHLNTYVLQYVAWVYSILQPSLRNCGDGAMMLFFIHP